MKSLTAIFMVAMALVLAPVSQAKSAKPAKSGKKTSTSKKAKEIERKVNVLGNIAYGYQTHKVKGKNAEDMVLKLYLENRGEKENFQANSKYEDLSFSDQVGWGTIDTDTAGNLYSNTQGRQDDNGEEKDNSDQLKVGFKIIDELGKMGMKFGYTDASSGYCGVSFMGLLVVDEENETIYEISLTDSGAC